MGSSLSDDGCYDMTPWDHIAGLIIVVFGLIALEESLRMPVFDHVYRAPGFFPAFLSVCLIVMGTALGYTGWARAKRRPGPAGPREPREAGIRKDGSEAPGERQSSPSRRLALACALIMGYVFVALGNLPYTVATGAFLVVSMLAFRAGHPAKLVAISAAVAICVSWAFSRVFMIPLP